MLNRMKRYILLFCTILLSINAFSGKGSLQHALDNLSPYFQYEAFFLSDKLLICQEFEKFPKKEKKPSCYMPVNNAIQWLYCMDQKHDHVKFKKYCPCYSYDQPTDLLGKEIFVAYYSDYNELKDCIYRRVTFSKLLVKNITDSLTGYEITTESKLNLLHRRSSSVYLFLHENDQYYILGYGDIIGSNLINCQLFDDQFNVSKLTQYCEYIEKIEILPSSFPLVGKMKLTKVEAPLKFFKDIVRAFYLPFSNRVLIIDKNKYITASSDKEKCIKINKHYATVTSINKDLNTELRIINTKDSLNPTIKISSVQSKSLKYSKLYFLSPDSIQFYSLDIFPIRKQKNKSVFKLLSKEKHTLTLKNYEEYKLWQSFLFAVSKNKEVHVVGLLIPQDKDLYQIKLFDQKFVDSVYKADSPYVYPKIDTIILRDENYMEAKPHFSHNGKLTFMKKNKMRETFKNKGGHFAGSYGGFWLSKEIFICPWNTYAGKELNYKKSFPKIRLHFVTFNLYEDHVGSSKEINYIEAGSPILKDLKNREIILCCNETKSTFCGAIKLKFDSIPQQSMIVELSNWDIPVNFGIFVMAYDIKFMIGVAEHIINHDYYFRFFNIDDVSYISQTIKNFDKAEEIPLLNGCVKIYNKYYGEQMPNRYIKNKEGYTYYFYLPPKYTHDRFFFSRPIYSTKHNIDHAYPNRYHPRIMLKSNKIYDAETDDVVGYITPSKKDSPLIEIEWIKKKKTRKQRQNNQEICWLPEVFQRKQRNK